MVDDTGNTNKFATQSQLNQIGTNQTDISTINSKIPTEATSVNKLADKNYVDTTDTDLQNQINNLKARGRFLALWNCATGLAESNPPESPYLYQTGDYFIVGTVSSANPQVNYKPNGSSYTTGVASSTLETEPVDTDDVYYYDGTSWHLQVNTQKTVSFVNIAGDPYDNTNLANALNNKQDVIDDLSDIQVDVLEERIKELPPISQMLADGLTPTDIVKEIAGEDVSILETLPVHFECKCSKERFERGLLSLGKEELEDIIEKDGKAHTICHFCGEEYDFTKEELEELAKQAK